MEVPGTAAALDTPQMREKADKRAETLRESLKQSVVADVQDAGVLRKAITVTVPAKVIGEHIQAQFDDLSSDAYIPGFRKGRAPRALVQKRYGSDVRDSLKTSILGQSYFAAVEQHKLEVLGDPLFRVPADHGVKLVELSEALTHLTVPESGDFQYECELEVKPSFELPELQGLEIKAPQVDITDAMVEEWIERQRKIRGRYEPLTGDAANIDDMLIADVTLESDGKEVKREANLQLGVRATRLDGITLLDLGEKLKGAHVGSHVETDCTIPDDYERADLRGKKAKFKFEIHELKRLKPIPLPELVSEMGALDEAQLRTFVREDMESERDVLVARAKREQVYDHLLGMISLELPEKLSARQTDRAVMRTVVELHQRGTPPSEIETKIDELRTVAKEQVARELKLQFILEKVAEKLGVRVFDEEVNTEIARIARRYNRRFDRVRDELQRDGLLMQLADQIRQDKAVRQILSDAKVVEVTAGDDATDEPAAKGESGGEKKARQMTPGSESTAGKGSGEAESVDVEPEDAPSAAAETSAAGAAKAKAAAKTKSEKKTGDGKTKSDGK